jgi:HEAT repeat protein
MYNYYPETIWAINKVLISAAVVLALVDILYVVFRQVSLAARIRKIAIIKKNLQTLARSGKNAVENICPSVIGKISNEEFLEIARDKELILSREFAEELRSCFVVSGKVSQIEKVARKSANKWYRIQAIISLGYANAPNAVGILKMSLVSKDPDIAYYSLLALGQIKTDLSARVLLDSIKNVNFSGNRIISLLEGFPSSVVEEASRATQSEDAVTRYWAVKLISRFATKAKLKRMEELTRDESLNVRAAACECLGKIGSPEARDAVLQCLRDKGWFVRMHAVKALEAVLGKEAINEIAVLLRDEEEPVRETVKQAMASNIETSLAYIEKFIQEDDKKLKKDCAQILEDSGYISILFKQILSREAHIRDRGVRLLEGVISSGAHLGLESALAGFDKESRKEVIRMIAQINKGLAEHIDQKLKNNLVEA